MRYVGPWEPKRRALDGALEAIESRRSYLRIEDIFGLMNGCKNVSKPYVVRAV